MQLDPIVVFCVFSLELDLSFDWWILSGTPVFTRQMMHPAAERSISL